MPIVTVAALHDVHYRASNVTLAETVKALRRERSWRQEDLARAADLSTTWISRVENGANTSADVLQKIADAFGVSIVRLLADEPIRVVHDEIRDSARDDSAGSAVSLSAFADQFDVIDFHKGMVEVPIEAEVACGEPMDFSVKGEGVLLPATFAPDPEKHERLVRARGDSMLEFGIQDGDYVVVEMRDGGVAATGELILAWLEPADRAVGGGVTLKRWVRRAGRKILQSGNPDFPSYELKDGDVFRLIGIVRRSLTMRYHPKISG